MQPSTDSADSEGRTPCDTQVVELNGHRHGPQCGHDMVEHNGHYDFVSDEGELHHEIKMPKCCQLHEKFDEPLFVSHGLFSQVLLLYVPI